MLIPINTGEPGENVHMNLTLRRAAVWFALIAFGLTPLAYSRHHEISRPVPGVVASAAQRQFRIEEATIASIHAAFKDGDLTCHELVHQYLNRIAAYDKQGPAVNSIITINPKALSRAIS